MTFLKIVEGDYIIALVKSNGTNGNITKNEYDVIRDALSRLPERREGYKLKLRADTLEWEYVPFIESIGKKISDEENFTVITGGESDEEE